MNFGLSLKKCILESGKKSYEVAEETGVTKTWLSTIKNQKHASGTTIEKFAKYFGISCSEFIAKGE